MKTMKSTRNRSVAAKVLGAPSEEQIIGILRTCAKYFNDKNQLFKKVVPILEMINFVPIFSSGQLNRQELQRLVPIIAKELTQLTLRMNDILPLYLLCQSLNVKTMPRLKSCFVLSSGTVEETNHLILLGLLLPQLEVLRVFAPVNGDFPVLRKLRSLQLNHGISKVALSQLFRNSLQLENFVLTDETLKMNNWYVNVTGIEKCRKLRELVLPLYHQPSVSLCKLANLTKLSLHHQMPWTGQHWLSIITPIIHAKRHELQCLTLDGSYLTVPLNLFNLQLLQCTALSKLCLSNCTLADSLVSTVPLSCQHLSFRRCVIGKLDCHLKAHALMQLLELFDCELLTAAGPSNHVLQTVLWLRKHQPTLNAIHVLYSQTINLRKEMEMWPINHLLENTPWIQIHELQPQATQLWQQPLGTITMQFGHPVNYMPDMEEQQTGQHLNRITAADIIKDIDKSMIGH
ncbi:uncharacterized protein Dwil_GK12958 [Drosophila willistoni]|uniref:Uncharacterized protein n=1 Tax=Drosophila willistoni TaxID=7260 RepID=B4NI76_DROWI|nr:uncharacterized protein LOC6651384 [Drosophila willistoni]EDW84768.1 uncharacterized protein Dwil_GK12958 [Drosophila willistoni]